MAFKLSIEQGKGRGQAFDFDAEQITVGRTEENDVVLYEQGVSRRHARIVNQGGKYFVEDLESANGTLLNGKKITREALSDGDRVTIGDVVFRFGSGEAMSPGGSGSTRIVAAPKDDRNVRPAVVAAPPPEGAPQTPPFNPRYVVLGVAGALIAAIAWAALQGTRTETSDKMACPPTVLDLESVKANVFGTTGESVCRVGKELKFGFNAKPRNRYIFNYAPFYTEAGSLEVLLNGKPVGKPSPLVSTRRSTPQEIEFSEDDVKSGPNDNANVVTIRVVKGSDWGIERLDLMPVSLDLASERDGAVHFDTGVQLYQQKNVAAANLYNAWEELRKARQLMEGLPDPKPPNLASARQLLQQISQELDKVCHDHLWTAHRDLIFHKYTQATEQYRYILAAFPGDDLPCRAEALDAMGPEERSNQQRSSGAQGRAP